MRGSGKAEGRAVTRVDGLKYSVSNTVLMYLNNRIS